MLISPSVDQPSAFGSAHGLNAVQKLGLVAAADAERAVDHHDVAPTCQQRSNRIAESAADRVTQRPNP